MSQSLTEKEVVEIKSLITLLDDEDESIYATARERLSAYGERSLVLLPDSDSTATVTEKRIAELRDSIIRSVFKKEFKNLKRSEQGDVDLEEGIFVIARQRYPGLNVQPYIGMLNTYAHELKQKLSSVTDGDEIFRRIVSFFVEEKNFSGSVADYYSEDNQYINRVLETKKGIPITLSAVYMLVGNRINLPIFGIGLPGHFVLQFGSGSSKIFFDPFNDGKILQAADCAQLVENLGFTFTEEYLEPISNRKILERILRNIILALEKKNNRGRIETLRQFIDTLNSDV